MMNFTNDEMNLMCIYQSDSRSGLIAALTEMRGYLDEDEAQLRDLTDSACKSWGKSPTRTSQRWSWCRTSTRTNKVDAAGAAFGSLPFCFHDSISQNRKNIDFGK